MKNASQFPLTEHLRRLLLEVHTDAGSAFSGIGVIVTNTPDQLPIIPLRPMRSVNAGLTTPQTLAAISLIFNEFHDGFHILSPNLDLLMPSQYFSPPINTSIVIDLKKNVGGRYMAALFGSSLPGVLVSGIASNTYGVVIFQDGHEVEPPQ